MEIEWGGEIYSSFFLLLKIYKSTTSSLRNTNNTEVYEKKDPTLILPPQTYFFSRSKALLFHMHPMNTYSMYLQLFLYEAFDITMAMSMLLAFWKGTPPMTKVQKILLFVLQYILHTSASLFVPHLQNKTSYSFYNPAILFFSHLQWLISTILWLCQCGLE